MPRPVVPIFLRPLFSSRPRSIRLWYGKMTWAFSLTTSCCGSTKRPRLLRMSISWESASGSTTTPLPMKQRLPGWSTPLGTRWRTVLVPPTTKVCPALAPPWKRTTTSAQEVKRSTIFPLPSSPHCAPTITTFDMRILSHVRGSKEDLAALERLRKLAQLLEDLGARPPIHVDEGQRLSIRSVAGEGELSDVHLRLAQRVSDVADDAGLVLVGHDQHRPGRRRLDREAVHPHDARLALADDGAGHLGRLRAGPQPQGHEAGEIGRVAGLHLGDGEAALPGEGGRGDLVDGLREEVPQDAFENRGGEAADGLRGDLAGVDDLHRFRGALEGKLPRERADLLAQPQERPEPLQHLGGNARDVDGVPDGAGGEVLDHRVADDGGDVLLGVLGGSTEMRRADEVRALEERMIAGRRLLFEDVERGASDPAGEQRLGERLLVDEPAAGAVDDQRAGLHPGKLRGADHVLRLLVQRNVQRDGIGALPDLLERDQLDAELRRRLGREERVVPEHAHAKRMGPLHDERADVSRSDHAERLSGKLAARREALLLPFPRSGALRCIGDLACEREEQSERVLRDRDAVSAGRVHHHDAPARGRGEVDVVDARPRPADDAQPARGLEDLLRHLGGAAHRERLVAADDLAQRGKIETDLHVHLGGRDPLEDRLRFGGEIVGDEDAHGSYPALRDASAIAVCAAASPFPSSMRAPRSARPRSMAPTTMSMSKSSK